MRKIAFILETRTDEYGYNIRGELISAAKNAEGTKVIEYQYTQISNLCDSASLREEFIPQEAERNDSALLKHEQIHLRIEQKKLKMRLLRLEKNGLKA